MSSMLTCDLLATTEERLIKDLKHAYTLQRRNARFVASLIALHGAETTLQWLKVPIDEQAPTPLTFRAKEAAYVNSPLYVKRDNCELIS